MSKFMCSIDQDSGMYKDLFTLQEDQLINIDVNKSTKSIQEKQEKKNKKGKTKGQIQEGKGNKGNKSGKMKGKDDDMSESSSDPDSEELDKWD